MQNSFSLFENFIDKINQKQIPLVNLRYKPYDSMNAYSGDYDFFTSKEYIPEILQTIFDLASAFNISFTIDLTKYTKTKIVLFDDYNKNIILEIWSSLEVRDHDKQTLKYIFWEDVKNHLVEGVNTKYALPLEIEALYYLSHLSTKSKNLNAPEIQKRVNYYKEELKNNDKVLQLYINLSNNAENINKVSSKANKILVELGILNDRKNFKMILKETKLKIVSELHKNKSSLLKAQRFIPVMGPDGVGKTTIIESICKKFQKGAKYYRFKKTYRGSIIYNAIYPILKASAKKRLNMKKIDKNQVDDLYGNLIFYIALLKYSIFIIINLIFRKFRFADRFFYDLFLKNIRFIDKNATLRENWEILLKRTPKVFWLIQLDAPNDVILSRKRELSENDLNLYRKETFKLYINKPSILYTYINTSTDIDTCTNILIKNSEYLK